jgi:outer membrane protein OmpA-like peptidoglycan-associated protein
MHFCLKYFVVIYALGTSLNARSQNLIPNSDFEKRNRFVVMDWKQPSREFYHYENKMVLRNGKLRYEWVNGLCLIQPQASEYMQAKLLEPLIANKTYHLSMDVLINAPTMGYIPKTSTIPHFHVYFSDTAYPVYTRTKIYTEDILHFDISKMQPSDSFTRVSTTFTAKGNEQFIILGNFFGLLELEHDHWKNEKAKAKGAILSEYSRLSMAPPGKMEFDLKKALKQADKRRKKYDRWYKKQLDSIDKYYNPIIENLPPVSIKSYDTRLYFDNLLFVPIEEYTEELEIEDENKPEFEENTLYRFNYVVFETNQSTLLFESNMELDYVGQILLKNEDLNIELTGHTDSINTEAYNLKLSFNRAKACAEYLIKSGIDAKRITYDGKGESDPIASNDTPEGRQMNRRVEFLLRRTK